MEDASLDDFLDAGGEDGTTDDASENAGTGGTDENAGTGGTDENAETGGTDENAETGGTDENAETGGADENADETVDPARPTYQWSPGGADCDSCGVDVARRWHSGAGLVCADCKEW